MVVNSVLIVVFHSQAILLFYPLSVNFVKAYCYSVPCKVLDPERDSCKPKQHPGLGEAGALGRWRCLVERASISVAFYFFHWFIRGLGILLESRTASFIQNIFWFSYGVYNIFSDRKIPENAGWGIESPPMIGDENELGFGQLVPIFLLSSTLLITFEAYQGKMHHMFFPLNLGRCGRNLELTSQIEQIKDEKKKLDISKSASALSAPISEDEYPLLSIHRPQKCDSGALNTRSADQDDNRDEEEDVGILPLSSCRSNTAAEMPRALASSEYFDERVIYHNKHFERRMSALAAQHASL